MSRPIPRERRRHSDTAQLPHPSSALALNTACLALLLAFFLTASSFIFGQT